ncbi:M20/M25/M40 family metallo-hydrolase [Helicobacter turcicus]|uniref:M20/M25/M40 family metallo-hydrolase n=1 Tax=Helicobacter turcicus TaxID=2867412 RepID=A0ABS7JMW0_9HELI|nr:M20/M25/M40 family metallo-hydrolase [Helicobacter turcicus]MBX7490722.1 M20/M25/M40 family metallo-hydrolase [Helicobacter turcicus]MBX7545669.1 M20/M25/M40 family metallo-hydrolase [Helicobacter turcicus]
MEQNMQKSEALDLFLEICKIPHASKNAEALREWIVEFALQCGASVQCDKIGNIHCIKGAPKLCLQGHYDMVYVSKNTHFSVEPEFVKDRGRVYLQAKDSSLGADNGIAVACALIALKECRNIECLFTSDEEIGMIGANNIALDLQAEYVLNCDSEDINEVVYGCAGGYDLESKITFPLITLGQDCVFYKLESKGFDGGHSGIMIHKNIPNAIIECSKLASKLVESGALIVQFSGGEKRNSIPIGAELCVAIPQGKLQECEKILKNSKDFSAQIIESHKQYFDAKPLLEAILSLENGALVMRENVPILSSNIGILRQSVEEEKIVFTLVAMGRGNEKLLMLEHLEKEKNKLKNLGFNVEIKDYYAPWEREDNAFVQKVWEIYKGFGGGVELKEIHAGLECGILKQKYPKASFVSIGPTILNPHSLREKLDVGSFVHFDRILKEILRRFDAF